MQDAPEPTALVDIPELDTSSGEQRFPIAPEGLRTEDAVKSEADESLQEMTPVLVRALTPEIMQRLERAGSYNLGVDLAATMFDTLVDLMAPEGTMERTLLERTYQTRVTTVLDALEASLNRMRLTQGVPGINPRG